MDNTFLYDPLLFSFATGISSALAGITKISIESIFDLFTDNALAKVGGDYTIGVAEAKSLNSCTLTTGSSSGSAVSNNTPNSGTNIPPLEDFSKLDYLLNNLKNTMSELNTELNSNKIEDLKREIDKELQQSARLAKAAFDEMEPKYGQLFANFRKLSNLYNDNDKFNDLISKAVKNLDELPPDPTKDLYEKDPVKF